MRRVLLSLVVLAVAGALARLPPVHPDSGDAILARAREIATYELGAGPVSFPLAAGQRRVRILTNLDLPPGTGDAGLPYTLVARFASEAKDRRFRLLGRPARAATGAAALAYLGQLEEPAATVEVALDRADEADDVLTVSLAGAPAAAALRVLVSEERPPWRAEALRGHMTPGRARALAEPLGSLAWDDLPEEVRDGRLARRWVRAPASPRAPSRRLYVIGRPVFPVRAGQAVGEPVGDGAVVAYTLHGPGTAHVVASEGPLVGGVRVLSESGEARREPLALAAGERLSLALGEGLFTLRVAADAPGRVRLLATAPTMVVAPARIVQKAGADVEVSAGWTSEEVAVADAGDKTPVVYDLTGRDGAAVRVSVRALAPRRAARVVVRAFDRRGTRLAEADLTAPAATAAEDRVVDPLDRRADAFAAPASLHTPGEVQAGIFWPPLAAVRLEVVADAAVALTVASPAFARDEAPAARAVTRLRGAATAEPSWLRFAPANAAALAAEGRVRVIKLATRLEQRPPPPAPPAQAESLEPVGQPPRLVLLVPERDERSDAAESAARARPVMYELPVGAASRVTLDAPPGAGAGATVIPALLYAGVPALAGGDARVRVDDKSEIALPLYAARGQVQLPPVPVGVHTVRVSLPAAGRVFIDRPVSGARRYRSFGVTELAPGARAAVRLVKGTGARALGVVVYADGPTGASATLTATIGGGHPRLARGRMVRDHTMAVRRVPLALARLPGALYLTRTAPGDVFASEPLFLPLGDDLAGGTHEIVVGLAGMGGRAFVRFFAYGAEAHERVAHTLETHRDLSL